MAANPIPQQHPEHEDGPMALLLRPELVYCKNLKEAQEALSKTNSQ
jgi:ribosomal protein S4E